MGARGGVGRRRSDGRKGVSLSELDLRRSQASSDALRRRQKAKAAAKTKRHYQYREKQRLLGELEASRKASATPIVAAELGTYAEDSGGDAASEDCLKHEAREGRNKRARSSATSTGHGADNDATDTAAKQTPHDEVPQTEADIKSVASLRPRSGSRGHQPFHKELKEAAERKAEKVHTRMHVHTPTSLTRTLGIENDHRPTLTLVFRLCTHA